MDASYYNLYLKYKSKGILIDTNLLLLLLVGFYDENLIAKFKRTSKYSKEDFQIIRNFILHFEKIIITP
jgi:hypothetical protein